jgi:CubicO group peptidase (beta-lactamase class C family)
MKYAFTLLFLTAIVKLPAQNKSAELDKFFSALSHNQQFNGNVLIAEKGHIIYEKSFGIADFSTNRKNTKKSTFPIASITKSFTAVAILQLSEKGKLRIDDPVVNHLPGFPYPSLTIRHLLSHTSGLPSYDNLFNNLRRSNPDTIFSNKDILPGYAELKWTLLYQPGSDGNYDNVNYIFLALIIEKVSGSTYRDYIKKNILDRAGMKDTRLAEYNDHYTPAETNNLSIKYYYPHLYSDSCVMADTVPFIKNYWRGYNFKGFGEMISTAEDLLKYDKAIYSGILLKPATSREMFTPVKLTNGTLNPGNRNGSSFGLGWIVNTDTTHGKVVRGSGGAIGLRASMVRNITKHQTIIIFDNMQNETDDIARAVLKIINGEQVRWPGKSMAKEFGKILIRSGVDEGLAFFEKVKNDTLNYSINEDQFNNMGYELMGDNKPKEALATFKLNTELFPGSWNVYDSYGEALLKYGQTDEALKMYRKSVELNPGNENGKKVLADIRK